MVAGILIYIDYRSHIYMVYTIKGLHIFTMVTKDKGKVTVQGLRGKDG